MDLGSIHKQRARLKGAEARGHKMGEFNQNRDIWIARCTACKDAAIIHEDGHISGNALDYDCTENNGP